VQSKFQVSRCTHDDDLGVALSLTSEAHTVPVDMLAAGIGAAALTGVAEVWLARDGEVPVSTVWICRYATTIGVLEMMTPKRFQGRGAGKALLTTAMADTWSPATSGALLLSTPAGRRLYESVGFQAVDESVTFYRGLEESVLKAIGQPA
jgi:GNAT superfamily N-acetyltransferase